MLNHLEIQNHLANLIIDAAVDSPARVHIYFWEGKIQCLNAFHTEKKHGIFKSMDLDTAITGLTIRDWNNLSTDIFNFLKENPRCLDA